MELDDLYQMVYSHITSERRDAGLTKKDYSSSEVEINLKNIVAIFVNIIFPPNIKHIVQAFRTSIIYSTIRIPLN